MPRVPVRLVGKKTVASGTEAFYFEKPPGFSFRAGQYAEFTIEDLRPGDAEGPSRCFSICTAPGEEYLGIATRMRPTAFKNALAGFPAGTSLLLEGPMGSLTLHANAARPAALIAGGIGITPFRSIILDAAARKLPHRLCLFYSNRKPADAAFLEEFFEHAKKNPRFAFIPTMTDGAAGEGWKGERGYVTGEMIRQRLPEGEPPVYYIAGPTEMVSAMRNLLLDAGASDDDIKTEEFSGY